MCCSSCNPKGTGEKQHQCLFAALCLKPDLLSGRMCRIHHLPAEAPFASPKSSLLQPMSRLLAGTRSCTEGTLDKAAPQAGAGYSLRCRRTGLSPLSLLTGWISLGSIQLQERLLQVLLTCCHVFKECKHFPMVCIPQRGRYWAVQPL